MPKKNNTKKDESIIEIDDIDRFLSPETEDSEDTVEVSLRPQKIKEYIGQEKIKESLKIFIDASKKRGEAL